MNNCVLDADADGDSEEDTEEDEGMFRLTFHNWR